MQENMNGSRRLYTMAFSIMMSGIWPAITQADDQANQVLTGTLRFEVEYEGMVTPMRYYSDGKHLRVELGEEGDPYLIWIRGIEGMDGIAALSPMEKNYSVEFDGPPMWDRLNNDGSIDKRRRPKDPELPDGKPETYKGFTCIRYELKTDGPDTTVIMLENAEPLPFLVTRLWKNLADAAPHLQLLARRHNGIPLMIERKKWSKRPFFSLQLVSHDASDPNPALFNIPEGYYQIASQIRSNRRGGGGGPGGGGGGGGQGRQR